VRIKEVPERAVAPTVDEQREALRKRYDSQEITLDEATEEMKRIILAEARQNLGDVDYEALAEGLRTMPFEEITIDEALEELKQISLAEELLDLVDADDEALDEYIRTLPAE